MTSIRYDVTDHVARLTLDRPEKLNAFDAEMATAVLRQLEQTSAEPDVRVLVLTGAGRAFSAGGDLSSMTVGQDAGQAAAPERGSEGSLARTLLAISEHLRSLPAVSIAAVRGACAGGALGWACACDLRIASTTARFVPAFGAVGQTGDYGISWTLPRLVGAGQARDLLLVGDHLDAHAAERIGLVTRVVEDDAFDAAVDALAGSLAARAPLALQGIKRNLDVAERATLAEALDCEAAVMAANNRTEDAAEAIAAFFEKRTPRFVGR